VPDSCSQQLQLHTVSSTHVECRLESMMMEERVWGRQYVAAPSLSTTECCNLISGQLQSLTVDNMVSYWHWTIINFGSCQNLCSW